MRFRDEYEAAQVPMLPVIASDIDVVKQILLYSYAMVGTSLVLTLSLSWIYLILASASGVWFLFEAHKLKRLVENLDAGSNEIDKLAMKLFHGSISYLAIIFFAVGLDALILHH